MHVRQIEAIRMAQGLDATAVDGVRARIPEREGVRYAQSDYVLCIQSRHRSSHKIEHACYEDLAFGELTGK